jgi:hypothetical protein
VLRDTYQTVLIETDDCTAELSLYSKDHLHRVIRFGTEKWLDMIAGGEFASVLFFKNHGPSSGGTISHPHMQIVGLRHVDYMANIPPASLEGIVISRDGGVELAIADKPLVGFTELNLKLADLGHLDRLADYLQICAHYFLNNFNRRCNSYNIFFYHIDGRITAKIMPRFVTLADLRRLRHTPDYHPHSRHRRRPEADIRNIIAKPAHSIARFRRWRAADVFRGPLSRFLFQYLRQAVKPVAVELFDQAVVARRGNAGIDRSQFGEHVDIVLLGNFLDMAFAEYLMFLAAVPGI